MKFLFNLCKYRKTCDLYRESSRVCTHGGSTYCGKYRELEKAKGAIIHA